MKYKLIIDPSKEEEIVITCHNKREIFDQIEQLISQENNNLLGYENDDIYHDIASARHDEFVTLNELMDAQEIADRKIYLESLKKQRKH